MWSVNTPGVLLHGTGQLIDSIPDQTKPTCLRCSKSKINCLGYRDCFVDGQAKKSRSRDSFISRPKSISSQTSHGHRSPANAQHFETSYHLLSQQSSLDCCSLHTLPWKDNIMISYLIKNSRAGPMTVFCQGIAASNASESAQRTTTKQCLLALATALYGTGHSQRSLVMQGKRQYGHALNMVKKIVQKPQDLNLTEAMASVYALSLFEVKCSQNLKSVFGLISFHTQTISPSTLR